MRIALAQINPTLGAFEENAEKIISEILRSKERKCDLVLFPEACLFGYHPFDLLERKKLVELQLKQVKKIEQKIPKDITAVFGLFTINNSKNGKPYFNSAAVVTKGKKTQFFHKELLPTGDVFDEARFIQNGQISDNIFSFKKKKILITICEDIWAWPDNKNQSPYKQNPLIKIKDKVDLVLNLSASPFYSRKIEIRQKLVQKTALHFRAPVVYVNTVGAQDEIIFDGGSFAVNSKGKLISKCVQFEEDLNVVDIETMQGGFRIQKLKTIEEIKQALVLGIRDFCSKTGIQKIHLGLSGGIDSAVVACLAVDALGPNKVKVIAMPGPYNAPESLTLSHKLAENLGIEIIEFPIDKIYESLKNNIDLIFSIEEFGVIHENLQARIRGLILMSLANKENSLLLATGNKSEFATGYSTLYGDMCGGLLPIADLQKKQVYELANYYNTEQSIIPLDIIQRAPSAELRPNQKDQDSLPEYKLLDKSVENIVENCLSAKSQTDKWLIKALLKSEFKRWQAAPILKISKHAFGRGRRFPISHRAKEV